MRMNMDSGKPPREVAAARNTTLDAPSLDFDPVEKGDGLPSKIRIQNAEEILDHIVTKVWS